MTRLAGKIALITGAGSGFGEGMARRFAVEGARVAALDVRPDQVRRVVDSIGGDAIAIEADVSSSDDVSRAVERTVEAFGVPDGTYCLGSRSRSSTGAM